MLARRLVPFKPPKAKFVSPKRCTFEPTVTRRCLRFARARGLGLALGLAHLSCSEPPQRSLIEDQTRRVAPLPACVLYLPARRAEAAGTARKLREEQIVKLILPRFVDDKRALPKDAVACTGLSIFDDPLLAGGAPARGGWPFAEQEGDVLYGSGGDRIKVVWLRVVRFGDGTVGGPIAIVRATERFAEAFAVGTYRGHADRVRLGTQRLGGEIVVTAQEDTCAGRRPHEPCENRLSVLLPRAGVLRRAADIPIERVAYASHGEHGAMGIIEYRLTTSAEYKADGIHVTEQIRVNDDGGRELRKAELERVFTVNDAKGTLECAQPALWDSVVGSVAR
jgi:hypothetical protein